MGGNGRAHGRATGQIFLFGGPMGGPSAVPGDVSGTDGRAGEARPPRSRGSLGSRGEAELLTPRASGKEEDELSKKRKMLLKATLGAARGGTAARDDRGAALPPPELYTRLPPTWRGTQKDKGRKRADGMRSLRMHEREGEGEEGRKLPWSDVTAVDSEGTFQQLALIKNNHGSDPQPNQ
ncbi:hypothetical protein T484DRAFT_1908258, partial [Baffinella frigidus]